MNKRLIKIGSLVLSGMMCVYALSSCGRAEKQSVEVVRVWTSSAHSKELITQMVSDYNKTTGKTEGIQVEYSVYGSDYNQVLNMALESGQAPEIFGVPSNVRTMVDKGQLMAIEDLPDTKSFLAGYSDALQKGVNIVNGKTYHLPFKVTAIGLIYNKQMLIDAGYVDEKGEALPPKTWEQVREYAKTLTKPNESKYGFAFPLKWDGSFSWDLLMPFEASLPTIAFNRATGKYDFSVYKPALEWLMQMKNDNLCFPGAEGLDNDTARAQFAAERIAMMIGASWDVGVFSEQFVTNFDWGVTAVPYLNENEHYLPRVVVGPFVGVNADVEGKDLSKISKVYQWLNSPEFLTKLYEEGKEIPYNKDIIANAKPKDTQKNWTEFAALVTDVEKAPAAPTVKLEGNSEYVTYSKVWAGTMTVDEALDDLTTRYNAALQKGIDDGSINIDDHIVKDYEKKIINETK